jgi:uncharacterized linocin/CFP29 family protein
MDNNNGRESLPWSTAIWDRIDAAVHEEAKRTKVAARFVPLYGPLANADDNVPADTIQVGETTLTADRGVTTVLIEIGAGFAMTQQQVEGEENLSTAVTLATRATNFLSQGEDLIIFQGQEGNEGNKAELIRRVNPQPKQDGRGLLEAAEQFIDVQPMKDENENPIIVEGIKKYGENTFAMVALAYSRLQEKGHYGPYALVLHANAFADTHAPLEGTLIMPADRIKSLLGKDSEGRHMFYGTGTLLSDTGLMMSLGGNTIDLASGNGVVTTFVQKDTANLYQFRVVERFTVRLKDKSALVRLNFL